MSYSVNVPQASIGQSTTCLTCGIRLPSLETQQQHHKSDWHTYNLKRKMVYLPPVASEVFAQLVTGKCEKNHLDGLGTRVCVPRTRTFANALCLFCSVCFLADIQPRANRPILQR
jgi:pre-60S factor REI1